MPSPEDPLLYSQSFGLAYMNAMPSPSADIWYSVGLPSRHTQPVPLASLGIPSQLLASSYLIVSAEAEDAECVVVVTVNGVEIEMSDAAAVGIEACRYGERQQVIVEVEVVVGPTFEVAEDKCCKENPAEHWQAGMRDSKVAVAADLDALADGLHAVWTAPDGFAGEAVGNKTKSS